MMPRYVLYIMLIWCLTITNSYAAWLPITNSEPANPHIQTLGADHTGTTIQISTTGIFQEMVEIDGIEYTHYQLLNSSHSSIEGAPAVPMISLWVAIPPMADVELHVQTNQTTILENINPFPHSDDPQNIYFDDQYYQQNSSFPASIAEMGTPQIFREVRFVPVQVYPVQVNPQTKQAKIHTQIQLRIVTSGENGVNPLQNVTSPSPAFEKLYRQLIVNYDQIYPSLYGGLRDVPSGLEFLIIIPDNLLEYVQDFALWRNQRGLRTYVAPFSETGSTNQQIKSYIQNLYNNSETRPSYIMLVGRGDIFPSWYTAGADGSSYLSDNPYGTLSGDDEVVDVYLGRLPCSSPLQLQMMINRIYTYEREPVIDGSEWTRRAVMICPQESSYQIKDYIADDLLVDIGDFIEVDKYYYWGGGPEVRHLLNEEGRNFINFRGTLSDYQLTPNLINPQYKFPFLTWLTCGTCVYNYNDFCVLWMIDGNGDDPEGAIGVIGGSQITTPEQYARRRDALDVGIYEAFFILNMQTLGESLLYGKLHLIQQYPFPDIYTHDTNDHFALMGDPTTRLWTAVPKQLALEFPEVVPFGETEFSITVTDTSGNPMSYVQVALTEVMQDSITRLVTGFTGQDGEAILPLVDNVPGILHLSVNGQNVIPVNDTVLVVAEEIIEGYITDRDTNEPLPARVSLMGHESFTTIADTAGWYRLYLLSWGEYQISANYWGYEPYVSDTIAVNDDEIVEFNIEMNPYPMGIIEGYVYDENHTPIPNATVAAFQETNPLPVITDENGYYQIECTTGYPYAIRVEADGYSWQEKDVSLPAGGTATQDFSLMILESFEEDDGDFYLAGVIERNQWEWGVSTMYGGPIEGAYMGRLIWGTALDTLYHSPQASYLQTPVYRLPTSEEFSYHLIFHQWYETDMENDGGQVRISVDHGDTWELIHPIGDYPVESIIAFNRQPGYSGFSDSWQEARFDLSDYLGEEIIIQFRFGANWGESYRGWFIDGFAIRNEPLSSVETADPVINIPSQTVLYQNYPNPFNPITTIQFSLPQEQTVSLQVYDIQGRLIKSLLNNIDYPAGRHTLVWQGTDQQDQAVRSGVYFYRLESGDFQRTKKMILLR